MVKTNIKNIIVLVVLNIVAFIVHHQFINTSIQAELAPVVDIKFSYLTNAIASLSVCVAILFLKKKYEDQIGFVFLGLSVVKMILIFVLLNPTNDMGNVAKIDALALFIPFGLNLVMEQIFIVKLLKISDLAKELKKS
ncbi:DUF6168 family protein [Wenyingzhuangia sp. chi5]|uniref:DUF6168 family protein n=1 Tax=Wenyingzhuangia gilva TaxID=3057677 RepID=A0ABT8VPJ4_9FLAO|nr:DUF6168 family protein [Wenyingzhuangia sp. chi5]MDO3693898.1 DUF6168 family protein [Wenyingzhuangia sp. chi5]